MRCGSIGSGAANESRLPAWPPVATTRSLLPILGRAPALACKGRRPVVQNSTSGIGLVVSATLASRPVHPVGHHGTDRFAGVVGAREDVVSVAWASLGQPAVDLAAVDVDGECARCGARREVVAAAQVVSRGFTGRSEWALPAGGQLCRGCAWAFRDPRARRPMVVDRASRRAEFLQGTGLRQVLASPICEQVAVTVPRTGRKHLLPSATWGRIFVDEVAIPWSGRDAARLEILEQLRRLGASETDLRAPVPPWPLLAEAGRDRAQILTAWHELAPWRERTPWLEVALVATRQGRTTTQPALG